MTTLSLIQEALHKIDGKAPQPFLHKSGVIKKLKKSSEQGGDKNKLYVRLAGELLSNAAYFGVTGLGKKKERVVVGRGSGVGRRIGYRFPES